MGEQIPSRAFTRADRQRYREKVRRDLDALAEMLHREMFEFDSPLTGLEVELNLVDGLGLPAMRNDEVLARISDPAFVHELGKWNLEVNVAPRTLRGTGLAEYEREVRAQLNDAEVSAQAEGAGMTMIGILPTLRAEHLTHEAISAHPRYALLEEQMLQARGEELHIGIQGENESLEAWADSIAPESACTSAQLHLQVAPEDFGAAWNSAQCLAAAQVALGANSPFFMGRRLWSETRIALFQQATDTRPVEMKEQGVRPRVWFGERWVTSVFDLFEENLRYFPALLPIVGDEDPAAELAAGRAPVLQELRLHNGTVWRWNRPVYDLVDGRPHLRIENRVLPAGPTVVDMLANAAFYFGALHELAREDRPVWSRMSFSAAEDNFVSAAQRGLEATVYWPKVGQVAVPELILRVLLPAADAGLRAWGVEAGIRERLLGVIEGRCVSRRNGENWQTETVRAIEASGMDRWEALRRMTLEYIARGHSNTPVHTWDVPALVP